MNISDLPKIIQGGMGVGASGWSLAKAVSSLGQLGVVSGTGLDSVMTRRLQLGDPGGHVRRALAAFPFQDAAKRILDRYWREEAKGAGESFLPMPMPHPIPSKSLQELTIIASFTEIFLAKEGHGNPVGMNLLEKIQLPTMLAIFGAMLAGVDYILMGAGIPRQIPGILDGLAAGQPVEMRLEVKGDKDKQEQPVIVRFDPASVFGENLPALRRPAFLAIVTSPVLAQHLIKKSNGVVDGFIVEAAIAGGHNAPPRGKYGLSELGEPIYGEKDAVHPAEFVALGKPFWLAGGYGRPGKLAEALAAGAAGIQVGTAFAFCEDSSIRQDLRYKVIASAKKGELRVFTDPKASPTGFPFKIIPLADTYADPAIYEKRKRVCDIGLLRQAYTKPDGSTCLRCSAEPFSTFTAKGGELEDAQGRMCLCNGLLATIGLGQSRSDGSEEPPVLTAGDDAANLGQFLTGDSLSYSAADVIAKLLA